jgi:thioredoxin-dependent peroxiredoxin
MIDIGHAAPDVHFSVAPGVVKTLADFRGKPLVVYFYPKDDTSGCTKEAQDFSALAAAFATLGVAIIGISKDSDASHAKFIAKYGLGITLGSDADGSTCEGFGTWVEKSMYGKKYMGIERTTFLIDAQGKIAAIWRKVKVPGHADAVLEAAKTLK